jgi:hypothetical protein
MSEEMKKNQKIIHQEGRYITNKLAKVIKGKAASASRNQFKNQSNTAPLNFNANFSHNSNSNAHHTNTTNINTSNSNNNNNNNNQSELMMNSITQNLNSQNEAMNTLRVLD